jgi:hypothetical protein
MLACSQSHGALGGVDVEHAGTHRAGITRHLAAPGVPRLKLSDGSILEPTTEQRRARRDRHTLQDGVVAQPDLLIVDACQPVVSVGD